MKNLWRDFGFGLRLLKNNPGFTLVAVMALAIGIGANTAIYSLFYAILIADFPYPHSEQLEPDAVPLPDRQFFICIFI